jgi:uncharacterized protein YndB with AHSA1/START domain
MDHVTGVGAAVEVAVPIPREQMWELVTAVERIGEWSPEALGGTWCAGADGPAPGARFTAHNRFPNGLRTTVTCVVTEAERPGVFGWDVLDAAGDVGSAWRYELLPGEAAGTTLVRHTFTHGPGVTGARQSPGGIEGRLETLRRNMTATITAMTGAQR